MGKLAFVFAGLSLGEYTAHICSAMEGQYKKVDTFDKI